MKTLDLSLDDHLKSAAAARAEKNEISLVPLWPAFTQQDTPIFLGSYSWSFPAKHWRWLYQPTALDIGNGPQTPGEITRDYLDWKFPKPLRATTDQYKAITVHRAFPCCAFPGEYPDMAYVDLKSAYWSILRMFGWDADYFPGKWLGVSSSILDFPLQDHKPARSGLVTAGLSSPCRFWTGERLEWKTIGSRHINLGLWALVQDVLHGIADDMLSLGAVYVHTDGYIVPQSQLAAATEIAMSWGFTCSVKGQGDACVWGVGAYKIGSVQTKRQGLLPTTFFAIEPVHKDWLRAKCYFFSKRAQMGIDSAQEKK